MVRPAPRQVLSLRSERGAWRFIPSGLRESPRLEEDQTGGEGFAKEIGLVGHF